MFSQRSSALALVVSIVCLSLAACGTAKSTGPGPAEVVAEWNRAVADRDVGRACSLLDPEGRDMVRRELAGYIKGHYTGSSCVALMAFLHDAVMTAPQRAELRHASVRVESVTGAQAKVHAGGDFELTRTQGRWRISEIPLATSKGPVD